MEVWKDIIDYENYQISNLGRIKSKRYWLYNKYVYKDKILKPSKTKAGYLQVVLCKNGKTKNYFVHRLVAKYFLNNKNNYNEINHKDENKENNNVSNLEWCNHKYNMNYGSVKEKISKSNKGKQKMTNKHI